MQVFREKKQYLVILLLAGVLLVLSSGKQYAQEKTGSAVAQVENDPLPPENEADLPPENGVDLPPEAPLPKSDDAPNPTVMPSTAPVDEQPAQVDGEPEPSDAQQLKQVEKDKKPDTEVPNRKPPISKPASPVVKQPPEPKKPVQVQPPKKVVAPTKKAPEKPKKVVTVKPKKNEDKPRADFVPDGQELVNIDFPEPTDIKDIIRAVSLWTGKNVILGRDVSGKVQMISPQKVTKVEAYQAFLSALNLLGLTTVETGKVIKIIPIRSAVKSNLKTFLGSSWTPLTDELITQIIPLKYINAREIQTKLARIISSNSMIAYEPTNTLIVSDSGYKVRRILDIIELLDVQTQQPKVSIVPIKFGDAKTIAAMVQDIFKAQQSGGSSKSRSTRNYLTYKIMTDERTNSVVIFGPPRTIADVKSLVRKFDVEVDDPTRQSSIHVRPLDFADAKKLATTLSALASGGSSSSRRAPITRSSRSRRSTSNRNVAPPVATLDNNVKITADESSNSLLITGSRAAYDALNSIIRKLDVRRSQVFVEAEILDINAEGGFKFATSVFAGAKQGNNNVAYTWQAQNISPLIISQAAGTTDAPGIEKAAGPFAEDLNIGILTGEEVDIPGIGKISPGALIKMIKTDAYTRVLSSPHILTSNNEVAKITVGDRLYFKAGSEISASGTAVGNVKHEDVDLSLEIKPNISHSNYVTMKIDLDASSGTIDSVSRLPSVLKRKTSQIVTVKNSQTVVISGLVKTSEIEIYQKIPLLGDIPILGWLFRNTDRKKQKQNLMIFLTPHIVHGANDLAAVYDRKISERDEILEKIYGSGFKDDDFYKLLPKREAGIYHADAYDVIDEKRRAKRSRDVMRDMGYASEEIEEISNKNDGSSKPEESSEAEAN